MVRKRALQGVAGIRGTGGAQERVGLHSPRETWNRGSLYSYRYSEPVNARPGLAQNGSKDVFAAGGPAAGSGGVAAPTLQPEPERPQSVADPRVPKQRAKCADRRALEPRL